MNLFPLCNMIMVYFFLFHVSRLSFEFDFVYVSFTFLISCLRIHYWDWTTTFVLQCAYKRQYHFISFSFSLLTSFFSNGDESYKGLAKPGSSDPTVCGGVAAPDGGSLLRPKFRCRCLLKWIPWSILDLQITQILYIPFMYYVVSMCQLLFRIKIVLHGICLFFKVLRNIVNCGVGITSYNVLLFRFRYILQCSIIRKVSWRTRTLLHVFMHFPDIIIVNTFVMYLPHFQTSRAIVTKVIRRSVPMIMAAIVSFVIPSWPPDKDCRNSQLC